MKLVNEKLCYPYLMIYCLNSFITVYCFRDKENIADIFKNDVEQGTKVYEFQFDSGKKADHRPDSELTYLELLDRNISKILMDPKKGQGPYLVLYVKTFAEQSLRLRNMIVNKTEKLDPQLMESAIKVYHRYGHPRFMTVIVTNGGEYLQNTLELSDDLMWEFYCYRQKANEFWDDIRKVMVRDHRSDKIEAERFRNLPWPLSLDNLTSFEKEVLARDDLNSAPFNLKDAINIKSTLF